MTIKNSRRTSRKSQPSAQAPIAAPPPEPAIAGAPASTDELIALLFHAERAVTSHLERCAPPEIAELARFASVVREVLAQRETLSTPFLADLVERRAAETLPAARQALARVLEPELEQPARPPKWFSAYDAGRVQAVRNLMGARGFYRTTDIEGDPMHARGIRNARQTIRQLADQIDGNDALALSDLISGMSWTPIPAAFWRAAAERESATWARLEAKGVVLIGANGAVPMAAEAVK